MSGTTLSINISQRHTSFVIYTFYDHTQVVHLNHCFSKFTLRLSNLIFHNLTLGWPPHRNSYLDCRTLRTLNRVRPVFCFRHRRPSLRFGHSAGTNLCWTHSDTLVVNVRYTGSALCTVIVLFVAESNMNRPPCEIGLVWYIRSN